MFVEDVPSRGEGSGAEVASDGRSVWVTVGGVSVASYSRRGSHVIGASPLHTGPTGPQEWLEWLVAVEQRLGLRVSESHRPEHAGGRPADPEPDTDEGPRVEPRRSLWRWFLSFVGGAR